MKSTIGNTGALALASGLDGVPLDHVQELLLAGQVHEGMDLLFAVLQTRKLSLSDAVWTRFAELCVRHRLRGVVHEDPFTRRAFEKPRGYAGDAVMLDYIYGREEQWPEPAGMTSLGAEIFNYTTGSAASEAVRARRGFMADFLDRLTEELQRPHILSVAAGHLREAGLAAAVRRRKLGRFVAVDVDALSLEEVQRCYGAYGVETINASFRQLLGRRLSLGEFDLVYSTGLFDYLQLTAAQRLALTMFNMLWPGGRLLVANFLPGIPAVGYMETYMGWKLIYRTRREMFDIADAIPQAKIRDIRLFADDNEHIIFLQVTRK